MRYADKAWTSMEIHLVTCFATHRSGLTTGGIRTKLQNRNKALKLSKALVLGPFKHETNLHFDVIPNQIEPNNYNRLYLETKKNKLGHNLSNL